MKYNNFFFESDENREKSINISECGKSLEKLRVKISSVEENIENEKSGSCEQTSSADLDGTTRNASSLSHQQIASFVCRNPRSPQKLPTISI